MTTRFVNCQKLDTKLEGLSFPPFPNELGQRIYNHISKKTWDAWIQHQTMLINEYRLNLTDPKARKLLETEMRTFLFGEMKDGDTTLS